MPDPMSIQDILSNRTARTDAYFFDYMQNRPRPSVLSDASHQTASYNFPLKPNVLTIVSWNIETFAPGKSLKYPYVNAIINRILQALSADVCILLETREDSYINMNAIENKAEGDPNFKWVSPFTEEPGAEEEADEQDDEEEDDMDEESSAAAVPPDVDAESDEERLKNVKLKGGGEPLTFTQVVSPMTGRRWTAPKQIFMPDVAIVSQLKIADLYMAWTVYLRKCVLWNKFKQTSEEDSFNQACAVNAVKASQFQAELTSFAEELIAQKPRSRVRWLESQLQTSSDPARKGSVQKRKVHKGQLKSLAQAGKCLKQESYVL